MHTARRNIRVLASTILLGCGGATTETIDASICRQTYEFGNYGCTQIEGRVVNRNGAAIPGVQVVARGGSALGQSLFGYTATDTAGHYSFRLTRYIVLPGDGDSATVSVRAAIPFTSGTIPADSTVVTAHFADVGTHVKVTPVPLLTLPWP
jgi:hypothetical protein